jgi:hypothetical protein
VRQAISVKPGFNLNGSLQLRARRFSRARRRVIIRAKVARKPSESRAVRRAPFQPLSSSAKKSSAAPRYLGTSTGASQRDPSAFFKLAPLACELVTAFFRGDRTGAIGQQYGALVLAEQAPFEAAAEVRQQAAKVGPDRISFGKTMRRRRG